MPSIVADHLVGDRVDDVELSPAALVWMMRDGLALREERRRASATTPPAEAFDEMNVRIMSLPR